MSSTIGYTFYDPITAFRGVCIGHVQYITGCDQLLLQPSSADTTKRAGSEWFDILRLVRDDAAPRVVVAFSDSKGADRAAPSK